MVYQPPLAGMPEREGLRIGRASLPAPVQQPQVGGMFAQLDAVGARRSEVALQIRERRLRNGKVSIAEPRALFATFSRIQRFFSSKERKRKNRIGQITAFQLI